MTERIIEIIAEYLDMEVSEIKPEDKFSDVGLDSLDIMELAMQMDEEFGCKIEMSQDMDTIQKLSDHIASQK